MLIIFIYLHYLETFLFFKHYGFSYYEQHQQVFFVLFGDTSQKKFQYKATAEIHN